MEIKTQKVRLVTILRKIELFNDFFSEVSKAVNLGAQFNVFQLRFANLFLPQIQRFYLVWILFFATD